MGSSFKPAGKARKTKGGKRPRAPSATSATPPLSKRARSQPVADLNEDIQSAATLDATPDPSADSSAPVVAPLASPVPPVVALPTPQMAIDFVAPMFPRAPTPLMPAPQDPPAPNALPADLLPGPDSSLPITPEEAPAVDGIRVDDVFTHVSRTTRNKWDGITGPKALAYIANDKVVQDGYLRVLAISETLSKALGSPHIRVGHAEPSGTPSSSQKPIFPYLVYGITSTQLDYLLQRKLFITNALAIFVIPFSVPVSPFVMTLHQLPLQVHPENERQVRQLVRARLLESSEVQRFIMTYHDNIPETSYPSTFRYILDSISVTGAYALLPGGVQTPIYHLFVHPPSAVNDFHRNWLNMLFKMKFPSIDGTAVKRADFHCRCCGSLTHPNAICPFKLNPQWPLDAPFQPPSASPPPDRSVNTPRGGKNGRGRGNARGRRRN